MILNNRKLFENIRIGNEPQQVCTGIKILCREKPTTPVWKDVKDLTLTSTLSRSILSTYSCLLVQKQQKQQQRQKPRGIALQETFQWSTEAYTWVPSEKILYLWKQKAFPRERRAPIELLKTLFHLNFTISFAATVLLSFFAEPAKCLHNVPKWGVLLTYILRNPSIFPPKNVTHPLSLNFAQCWKSAVQGFPINRSKADFLLLSRRQTWPDFFPFISLCLQCFPGNCQNKTTHFKLQIKRRSPSEWKQTHHYANRIHRFGVN